jgi:3-hydroxybutyryl-CoA dehydrogenase
MFKTIGVIGAGTMGNGIAQVFAQSGFTVKLHDAAPAALDRARTTIEKSTARLVEKGKMTAGDRDAALGRLHAVSKLDDLGDADYVVEAVIEDLGIKRQILANNVLYDVIGRDYRVGFRFAF